MGKLIVLLASTLHSPTQRTPTDVKNLLTGVDSTP